MGYAGYANPYYVADPGAFVYDYARPIDTAAPPADDAVASQGVSLFDAARDSFREGAYDRLKPFSIDVMADPLMAHVKRLSGRDRRP